MTLFWFVYALFLFFSAWFFMVSAIAYWRSSRPAKPSRVRLPCKPIDVEKELVALEAQFKVAPVTALREAHLLRGALPRRQSKALAAVDELIEAFEGRLARPARHAH